MYLGWWPAQRYVLGIMGFFAVANAYTMRSCLSLAITEMVVEPKNHHGGIDPNACPGEMQLRNHSDPVRFTLLSHK